MPLQRMKNRRIEGCQIHKLQYLSLTNCYTFSIYLLLVSGCTVGRVMEGWGFHGLLPPMCT
jgi:hypothetical protein